MPLDPLEEKLDASAPVILHAKVELPPVFADNMVLQQQTDAALWGKAEPDAKVVITTTWAKDKGFHPAKAMVRKDCKSIRVYSPEVSDPVAVRYGMKNWSEATLYNCFGIPASPFRSDNWE